MKIDLEKQLGTVNRSVSTQKRDGKTVRAVTLTRIYDTNIEDLWDAATNSERLPRWFAVVTGDLKLGGRFQIKDNAAGTIQTCKPPQHLDLTWELGEDISWLEVQFDAETKTKSRLTLKHIVPANEHWNKYGPSATGVGWDLALVGMVHHLTNINEAPFNEETLFKSTEGKMFITQSCHAWQQADIVAGEKPEKAASTANQTSAFYTGTTGEGS